MAESKEEIKSLLMKVKVEGKNVGLKVNIQKTKIIASSPITSWQIDGETMEKVTDFIFGGSKITADGDCSHEIKRFLLLGRKAMINLDSRLKSRDITLPTNVCLVKAIGEGSGTLLQYFCLENPMEEPGRLQSMGLLESDTTEQLHFHFSLSRIGEMATHSSVLAWRIPEMGEPGGLLYGVAQSWTRLK